MKKKEVLVLKELLGSNKKIASEIRERLIEKRILSVNLLSSPGSGKTTLLERIAEHLPPRYKMAVIEGDIETERDAERIREKGIPAWQITTGGACHLEAKMIGKIFSQIPVDLDLLFIENVGNLVCPADFPLGTDTDLVVISVTEGDDMVRKHPKIFAQTDVVAINKVDLAAFVGVDPERIAADYRKVNPHGKVVFTAAKTGKGVEELLSALGF